MLTWTGTASVTNGDKTVTIASGGFLSAEIVQYGALAVLNGRVYLIDSLTDASHFELMRDFAEATGTVALEIWPVSQETTDLVNLAQVVARTQAQINVLDKNSSGLFYRMVGTTGPSNPGAGNLAVNNANPSLITQLYISTLDANSTSRDVQGILEIWGQGTIIILRSITTTAYYAYRLSATPTMGSGVATASVEFVDSDGILGSEPISVDFRLSGSDKDVDESVNTIADRAQFDNEPKGFRVMVANIGDGRAARYVKASNSEADWSDPIIYTGVRGPIPVIEVSATTLPTGAPASATSTETENGALINFGLPRGPQGVKGDKGDKGDGLLIGATGTLAGRSAYNSQPEGFAYVDTENGNLYFRSTSTPGVWSLPVPFGKGDKGDPGNDGAMIVTTTGVGDGTAGPYTLNAIPISDDAMWVSISGVEQYGYTLDGDEITFSMPVPVGVEWQVKTSSTLAVIEPADGSVGAAKIKSSEAATIRTAMGALAKPATAVNGRLAVFNSSREVVDTGVEKATTVQAQAGTNDTNYMTPAATVSAITAFSPPTDVSVLALAVAEVKGSRILTGDGIIDPFSDETGVLLTTYGSPTLIPQATGSIITDFTTRATAQNDGTTNQAGGVSAAKAGGPTSGYSGKNYSSAPKRINHAIVYGSNDVGLIDSSNPSVTLTLYGKNGSAPANGTDGTAFGSMTFTDTTNESGGRTITSEDINTLWDYVWVNITKSDTNTIYLAEVQFYERGAVITSGSINQVYNPALDLYRPVTGAETMISQSAGTAFGTMTAGGGLAASFDGNKSQAFAAASQSTGASGRIGKNFTGNPRRISKALVNGATSLGFDQTSGSTTITLTLYGKNGSAPTSDTDGTLLSSSTISDPNNNTTQQLTSTDQDTAWDYVWVRVQTSNDLATVAEVEFYTPGASQNMTLISVPYTVAASPAQARIALQIDTPLTLVPGTDFDCAVSRNGGSTWTTIPVTLLVTNGNVKTYNSPFTNLTGPAGTSMVFRIRSLTNKNVQVSGVVMQGK